MAGLMRMRECSNRIGVCCETLRRWIHSGKGPTTTRTPTGRLMISEADYQEWCERLDRIENRSQQS